MIQLNAMLRCARTGECYRLDSSGRLYRVKGDGLEYLSGGQWVEVGEAEKIRGMNLFENCYIVSAYQAWLSSLSQDDRDRIKMAEKEVQAWEMRAWLDKYPDDSFVNAHRAFGMLNGRFVHRDPGHDWESASAHTESSGFRLELSQKLRDGLAENKGEACPTE